MRQPVQSRSWYVRAPEPPPLTRNRLILLTAVAFLLSACGSPAQQPTGSPAPAPSAAPQPVQRADEGHLRIEGTRFLKGSQPFEWRGITAFRLIELAAHGREAEAIAYLDWAHKVRLTVVRVFLMQDGLFPLPIDDGLRALPRFLELAAARGIHVEAVVLTGTGVVPTDLESAVRRAGEIAAKHPNAVVELANEPYHPTQDKRLYDPPFMQKLAALVPPHVPVALGSAEGNEGHAAGRYATWHSPRSSGQDGWGHVLAVAEGAALVEKWKKPVIGDEPIGAAENPIPGRRDNEPERFRAAAALTKLAGLGATFHYEGGLQAKIPAGRELACFQAWSEGLDAMKALPEGGRFVSGETLNAIASVTGARAAFGRQFEDASWIVAVDGAPDAAVSPAAGWRMQGVERFGRLLVARLQRV